MTGTKPTRLSTIRSAICIAIAGIALLVTACSDSGETSVAAAESIAPETTAPEATAEPDSTTTPAPADLDEWAAEVIEALSAHYDAQFEAGFNEPVEYDDHIEILRMEAAIYGELASVTEGVPTGTELEAPALAFHEAVVAVEDVQMQLAELLDADLGLRDEYESSPDIIFGMREQLGPPADEFRLTCFALATEMTALDLPLLDCANSGQDDPTFDEDGDVGNVQPGAGDLSPGVTYEFAEFTRPVAIVPDEALRSESSADLMYLFVPGREGPPGAEVFFLGMDEILDPTAPRSPEGVESTVPMPTDFGEWLDASGLTVNAEGTSTAGDLEIPWWEFEQVPSGTSAPPISFAASDNRFLNGGNFQIFASPTIVWQVEHPAGPLLIIADPFWEHPNTTRDEAFAFVESLLTTMTVPGAG